MVDLKLWQKSNYGSYQLMSVLKFWQLFTSDISQIMAVLKLWLLSNYGNSQIMAILKLCLFFDNSSSSIMADLNYGRSTKMQWKEHLNTAVVKFTKLIIILILQKL